MTEIGDFMKLVLEAMSAWKKVEENINAGAKKKKKKKLKKACLKALKTGETKDLDALRGYLFLINWHK